MVLLAVPARIESFQEFVGALADPVGQDDDVVGPHGGIAEFGGQKTGDVPLGFDHGKGAALPGRGGKQRVGHIQQACLLGTVRQLEQRAVGAELQIEPVQAVGKERSTRPVALDGGDHCSQPIGGGTASIVLGVAVLDGLAKIGRQGIAVQGALEVRRDDVDQEAPSGLGRICRLELGQGLADLHLDVRLDLVPGLHHLDVVDDILAFGSGGSEVLGQGVGELAFALGQVDHGMLDDGVGKVGRLRPCSVTRAPPQRKKECGEPKLACAVVGLHLRGMAPGERAGLRRAR